MGLVWNYNIPSEPSEKKKSGRKVRWQSAYINQPRRSWGDGWSDSGICPCSSKFLVSFVSGKIEVLQSSRKRVWWQYNGGDWKIGTDKEIDNGYFQKRFSRPRAKGLFSRNICLMFFQAEFTSWCNQSRSGGAGKINFANIQIWR